MRLILFLAQMVIPARVRQLWSGESTESVTYSATRGAAQALGASDQTAGRIATGTDVALGLVGGGGVAKAATSRVGTGEVVGQAVFHTTSREGAASNILNGIDPKFLNSASRFGKGFYVAKEQATTVAELAHHGASPVNTMSFNLAGGKFLNATSPLMDLGTRFAPRALGNSARGLGYDGVIFNSLRNQGGTNAVLFNNFNYLQAGKILK